MTAGSGSRLKRGLAALALLAWGAAVLVLSAIQLGSHLASLPLPDATQSTLRETISTIRSADRPGTWLSLHVLAAECGCSKRVLKQLLERRADRTAHERIVFIGSDPAIEAKARDAGFDFESVTSDQLSRRFGVEAAPILIVTDGSGTIQYVGGYTERKQGSLVRDADIVARLHQGLAVAALPAYGCAVSQALKHTVDPTGFVR